MSGPSTLPRSNVYVEVILIFKRQKFVYKSSYFENYDLNYIKNIYFLFLLTLLILLISHVPCRRATILEPYKSFTFNNQDLKSTDITDQ